MTTQLERDLRTVLAEHAGGLPVTPDPYRRTVRAVAADRRRRVATLGGVVAAALAVVTVTPLLIWDGGGRPAPGSSGGGTLSRSVAEVELVDWPVRGDLAANAAALTQARTALEVSARAEGSADGIQLLAVNRAVGGHYVTGLAHYPTTEQDGERVALLIAASGEYRATVVDELDPETLTEIAVVARTVWTDGAQFLLVVAGPEIQRMELSVRRQFRPDGTVSRSYQSVGLQDGVYVRPLPPDLTEPVVRLRGYRDESLVYDDLVRYANPESQAEFDPGFQRTLAADLGVEAADLDGSFTQFATAYEPDLRGATTRVIWRGDVSADERAALVALELRTGATFQLVFQLAKDRSDEATRGVRVRQVRFVPAAEADRWPIAWISSDGDTVGCWLTIALPARGAARSNAFYTTEERQLMQTGTAGGAIQLNRCAQLRRPEDPGVLAVTDGSGDELLRWNLDGPGWDYERSDQPSAVSG